jgi:hypothetical protein
MKNEFSNAAAAGAVTAAVLAFAAAPAAAHHSHVMFDSTTEETITGTVKSIAFQNPHVYLFVNVAERGSGEVTGLIFLWQAFAPALADMVGILSRAGRDLVGLQNRDRHCERSEAIRPHPTLPRLRGREGGIASSAASHRNDEVGFAGSTLLDHLVGDRAQACGHVEAEGFRGFEVDAQFKPSGKLDREISRLFTLENAIDVAGCPRIEVRRDRPAGHQPAVGNE